MDSDPMSPKNHPDQVDFQGGNKGPAANQTPGVPVFGFVEPHRPGDSNGGPHGAYPAPSGGFDPQPAAVVGNYNKLVDPESQIVKNFSFTDQSIRRAFIRKVYSILMCQLLLTFGVVALFVFEPTTLRWSKNNTWLLYTTMITVFVSTLLMGCFENLLRKTPSNFIFLGFFTVCVSIMVAFVCTIYDPETVIMAVGITLLLCLGLTLFALQTKYDFTTCGGILLTALILLLTFGIVSMFFPDKTLKMVHSGLSAMLFSFYLIYDTQLMMGGEHKYSISPEDYIFASINIYLDIINLFLYILRIVGSKK